MALVRTSHGNMIDMEALAIKNKNAIAITGGGISMNAHGDHLGKGGKVIRKREDLEEAYASYAEANPDGSKTVDIRSKNITPDIHPSQRKHTEAQTEVVEPVVLDLDDVTTLLDGGDLKEDKVEEKAEEKEKKSSRRRKTIEDE